MVISIKIGGLMCNIDVDEFAGCCGLSILNSFDPFDGIPQEKYKSFFIELKGVLDRDFGEKVSDEYNQRVGSVIISDISGGFLYKFAKWCKLEVIHRTRNPKTNNLIYLFAYRTNPINRKF